MNTKLTKLIRLMVVLTVLALGSVSESVNAQASLPLPDWNTGHESITYYEPLPTFQPEPSYVESLYQDIRSWMWGIFSRF